jgi:hypothetical protein
MTFLVLSTRLWISRLFLGSKQVSGIYPFNRDIFHDEECMEAYATDRSTPPVAAAAFNSNSKTPKTSMDSTAPSIPTSKEGTRPFSPADIRRLPKPGHRKSSECKEEEEEENNYYFD